MDRSDLVRTLGRLTPADFATLVALIPMAAPQVSRHGTIPEQAAELIRWAESPAGPGLETILRVLEGLRDKRSPTPVVEPTPSVLADVYGGAIRFTLDDAEGGGFEEKNKRNGRFWAEVTFRLHSTAVGARLRGFVLNCYSKRALPAWTTECRLSVVQNDKSSKWLAFAEEHILVEPVRFESGETPMLKAISDFRPYLQSHYPYEWDYGFLQLTGWMSSGGSTSRETFSLFYRYEGARSLLQVEPPQVPRLSDGELRRLRNQGFLSEPEVRLLLLVHPVMRYLIFCEDDTARQEEPGAVELIRSLKERLADDSLPQPSDGGHARAYSVVLSKGQTAVDLPSEPQDPASLRMTVYGFEIVETEVSGRHVTWKRELPEGSPAQFRYIE